MEEQERSAADGVMGMLGDPDALRVDPQREIDRARVQRALFGEASAPSPRIGRYRLDKAIGQGAMGEVYLAFDDVLERNVAIKVVRRELVEQDSQGSARLLREARSLARLSHPNVVAVHEAGVDGDNRTWIAMEYVEGLNLRQWMDATPRGVDAILDCLVQAGRGLAAAHAAGLVHRDFKPDNVLVDAQGRARVGDFGVVRWAIDSRDSARSAASTDPRRVSGSSDLRATLTRRGALVGTPAYMSPEQLAGEDVDERSDQFSFCVTTWEALWGTRPFGGNDPIELCASILAGRFRKLRHVPRVPQRVEAALRRGLSPRRQDRFASIEALIARVAPRRAAPAIRLGAAALVLGGAGSLVARVGDPTPCERPDVELVGVWDDATSEATKRAIAAVDVPYSTDVAQAVVTELDLRATAWTDAWRRTCEAHRVAGLSDAQSDRSMACLQAHRSDTIAVVTALQASDHVTVERALDGVSTLEDPSLCLLVASSSQLSDVATREVLDPMLSHGRALRAAGDPRAALPVLEAAETEAGRRNALDYVSAARAELGEARLDLGDTVGAIAAWTSAVESAIAGGDDAAMARGWIRLSRVSANVSRDPERAKLWLGHAASAVQRMGEGRRAIDLSLTFARASTLALDEPAVGLQLAETVERDALPTDSEQREIGRDARNLAATSLLDLGRFQEAEHRFAEILTEHRERYGEHHPRTADAWYNLGIALDRQSSGAARAAYARALEIREAAYPAGHEDLGATHIALANVALREDRLDDAQLHSAAAMLMYTTVLPRDAPGFAEAWTVDGVVAHRRGQFLEAAEAHDKARAIYARRFGEDSINVAVARSNSAEARIRAGVEVDASEFQEPIAAIERTCGESCPYLAYPMKGLALVELRAGRNRAATATLERARELLGDIDPVEARELDALLDEARRPTAPGDASEQTTPAGH